MSRSTCPTPTLVGTKTMNNQQLTQQTNNRAIVDRTRLSGAARKRFHYLLKKGMSIQEAKIAALSPMNSPRPQHSPTVGGINNAEEQLDCRDTSTVWVDPAEYSGQTSAPAVTSIPAFTQMQRIPVQARLGAPVRRAAIVAVPTPPAFGISGPWEVAADEDDEEQLDEQDLNVAILPGDYPSELWTTPQLEAVQQSITDLVRRQSEDSAKPGFSECTFRKGWLSIKGNDISAVNWLMAMDTRLRPWEGASLKVMPESELPMERIFVGLFPALESTSVKYTLRLIDGQNEGLAVNDWRVLHRAQRGPTMKLALSIDSQSAALLRKRRYHLNYGFTSVQFRPKETAK